MVIVTFNYRLNAFGFLALRILSMTDSVQTSGNYGYMDQILALQWVQNNIHAFGGNSAKVCFRSAVITLKLAFFSLRLYHA